jgi:hypothetical protein
MTGERWKLECVCGRLLEIEVEAEPICPACGRVLLIKWEAGRAEIERESRSRTEQQQEKTRHAV